MHTSAVSVFVHLCANALKAEPFDVGPKFQCEVVSEYQVQWSKSEVKVTRCADYQTTGKGKRYCFYV